MEAAALPNSSRPSRILIVDDEPAVRLALEMALADTPHAVDSVENAEAALKILRESPPDLLLVDKNLPGVSGVQLIRQVREEGQEIVCAMITGYPSAESAMEMLQLGVRGYLEKPFDDIFAVVKRIDGMLAAKRASERLREVTRNLQTVASALPAAQPLTVFAVSPHGEEREWILQHTGELQDRKEAHSSTAKALHRMRECLPHLVVIDTRVREPEVLGFIESARGLSPEVQFAVVSEPPSIGLLTSLIDARVAAVIPRPLTEPIYRARLEPVLRRLKLRLAVASTEK
jgi:DNA-binding NtrC family response regulator